MNLYSDCIVCKKSGCDRCFYVITIQGNNHYSDCEITDDSYGDGMCEDCILSIEKMNHKFILHELLEYKQVNKVDANILKTLILISKRRNKYIAKGVFNHYIIPYTMSMMNAKYGECHEIHYEKHVKKKGELHGKYHYYFGKKENDHKN